VLQISFSRLVDSLVGSSPEKESSYFALSQHPPQLPEGEEGDKSHENHQKPGEEFMELFSIEFNKSTPHPLAAPKVLDRVLDEGKGTYKETENNRPEKGGIN
jgi:hypothetical protein